MRRPLQGAITALALVAALCLGAAPSTATDRQGPDPQPTTLASGLLTPLSLAAGNGGSLYVSQNFGGSLLKVDRHGGTSTVFQSKIPGAEVGAVSFDDGTVYFSENAGVSPTSGASTAKLMALSENGRLRTITDLARWESDENPDGDVWYGFRGLDDACLAQVPPEIPGLYKGTVDSHVYATLPGRGEIFVADAGGNSILAVNPRSGDVRTVAVLPPQRYQVTAEAATMMGLPDCVVGRWYYFEPVPTDVAFGPDGLLYVSSLPGGPEGPQLGARGRVFTVDPWSGEVNRVVADLLGPTSIAFSSSGDLYIAELFADRISVVSWGGHEAEEFLSVPLPAALAIRDGTLYATTNVLPAADAPPAGNVVSVELPKSR